MVESPTTSPEPQELLRTHLAGGRSGERVGDEAERAGTPPWEVATVVEVVAVALAVAAVD